MTPAPNPEPGFPVRAVRRLGMGLAGAPKVTAEMYRARPRPPGTASCETAIAVSRSCGGRKGGSNAAASSF